MDTLDFFSLAIGLAVGLGLAYAWFRDHLPRSAVQASRDEVARHQALAEDLRKQGLRLAADLDDARYAVAEQKTALAKVTGEHQSLREKYSAHQAEAAAERRQAQERTAQAETSLAAARQAHAQLQTRYEQSARELTESRAQLEALRERLAQQREEFATLQKHAREEFQNLSQSILKRSSADLREAHEHGLKQLLDPVRTKLQEFQQTVERKFVEEGKEKSMLRVQIEQLTTLNQDLSHEARQLTKALKGDSKTQGDWGEHRLERLLEAAGLQAGTHFDTQLSFAGGDSARQQRPDCIVKLPQNRCIIIDAKVSLTAYERFCGSETDAESREHLLSHVQSLRMHIKGLSAKRYQDLHQVECPDYVLLFVPLEPAFIAAVRERGSLFTEALDAQVVLVCPSTLLATMRTVSHIWQQEDQRQNAQQIAQVGRKLYDKFVGFVEDMNAVGKQLDGARGAYDAAMRKLSRSPKPNTTLVAQANKLRELGVDGKTLLVEEPHAG